MSADPTAVGEKILAARDRWRTVAAHELADMIDWSEIPAYDPGESLATLAHRRYHDELQQRAAAGDRYAISVLMGKGAPDVD